MARNESRIRGKALSALGAAAGISLLSTAVQAQQAGDASAAQQTQQRAALEEVVVTARRRAENLQESPVAVSAMTGDDMRERGIVNTNELTKSVPSLEISEGRASQIYIRGVGQRSGFARVDPTVGVYLDDLFIPRSDGQLLDTVDIDSVQVLRGPQGTLFGKNTTGGAMVLTLSKPGDTEEGYVDVQLGNFEAQSVRAAWTQPISDDFSVRVAVNKRKREGFTEDVMTGQKGGSVDRTAALFQAVWHASDDISVNSLLFFE